MSNNPILTSYVGTPTTNTNASSIHRQQQQQSSAYLRGERPASNYNGGNKNYSYADDEQRKIDIIVFFLVCMVTCIGFCFWYHRKNACDNRDNNGGDGMSRRRQLRENQVRLIPNVPLGTLLLMVVLLRVARRMMDG